MNNVFIDEETVLEGKSERERWLAYDEELSNHLLFFPELFSFIIERFVDLLPFFGMYIILVAHNQS